LLKNFPQGVQKAAFKSLKKRQIKIRLQTNLQAITADSITLSSGELVFEQPVDLVLWTAGTELVDWIKNLDTQHDSQGKLLVKPTLQLLDYREVFALGDINKICSAQHIPDTAQAAYQQASCAAKNLRSLLLKKRLHNFHYLHLGDMLTLGKKEAIVSSFFLNISGRWGGFLRRLIYIFRLPTMHHRWQVLKNFFNLTSRTKNTFS
jgi:NADH dehydrogenase